MHRRLKGNPGDCAIYAVNRPVPCNGKSIEITLLIRSFFRNPSSKQEYINPLQEEVIMVFENLDASGPQFKRDSWTPLFLSISPQTILEKAAVIDTPAYWARRPAILCRHSLVDHPRNPHAPSVHDNYRFLNSRSLYLLILRSEIASRDGAVHFHSTLQPACDKHGPQFYLTFKKWCDQYFFESEESFLPTSTGLHLRLPSPASEVKRPVTPDEIFAFIKELGNSFVPSYIPILKLRYSISYTPHERRWQLLSRGRYVEFNPVLARDTKFGLMAPGARIESTLMSLLETARWEYTSELGGEVQRKEN
ncbi:Coproporphyrinogen III oxidase [Flammula alnicola]|nr:Coproporphyrinogen III oxidase [Flammula alnicola]